MAKFEQHKNRVVSYEYYFDNFEPEEKIPEKLGKELEGWLDELESVYDDLDLEKRATERCNEKLEIAIADLESDLEYMDLSPKTIQDEEKLEIMKKMVNHFDIDWFRKVEQQIYLEESQIK